MKNTKTCEKLCFFKTFLIPQTMGIPEDMKISEKIQKTCQSDKIVRCRGPEKRGVFGVGEGNLHRIYTE